MSATATILPLTTTFVAPHDLCLQSANVELSFNGISTETFYTLGPTTSDPRCFPPGYTSASFFSPGLCPSGYYYAFNSTVNIGDLTETRASCCPGKYTANPTKTGARCSADYYRGPTVIGTVYGNAVSIRWQSTDFTTAPSTIASGTTTPATTSIIQNKSTKSQEPTLKSHPGLTTGAKVGIGLGVSLGVISALAALFFYTRRKRRECPPKASEELDSRAKDEKLTPYELPTPTHLTAELPDMTVSNVPKPVELE